MAYTFNKIRLLFYKPGNYGRHSGYTLAHQYLTAMAPGTTSISLHHPFWRIRNRIFGLLFPARARESHFGAAEYAFLDRGALHPRTIYHVMAADLARSLWRRYPGQKNLVATFHFFNPENLGDDIRSDLSFVHSAITLTESHLPVYEGLIGAGRVQFVRHGVDLDYFRPKSAATSSQRMLFVGRVARDFEMLAQVLHRLAAHYPDLGFDLVLMQDVIGSSIGKTLAAVPRVRIHNRISDRKLLKLYQEAYLLLMPLVQAGANNSIIEALASGLPVLTTNAGGVYSYGAGSVYPVVEIGDVEGMVELAERYLADTLFRDRIATEGRKFAEQFLRWEDSARAHLEAYETLISG